MKLYEIKLQALRLMFADSDIAFTKNELFGVDELGQSIASLYDNGNTRDKLVRMNDSISRGIDLYYQYCGQRNGKVKKTFFVDTLGVKQDYLECKSIENFDIPNRVDLIITKDNYVKSVMNIPFYYETIEKNIYINMELLQQIVDYKLDNYYFNVYYNLEAKNLPESVDDNFDLSTLYIEEDVLRMLPKYVKSELYEEDEVGIAQLSKNEYIQFLINKKRKISTYQTRVINRFKRG